MKKIFILGLAALSFNLQASEDSLNGEELFKEKCTSCHTYYRPADISKLVAPPIVGLMRHMRADLNTNEAIIEHVKEFVHNPTKEKAVCPSVKRFGLMPSQKGVVTKEELSSIAKWMIEKF